MTHDAAELGVGGSVWFQAGARQLGGAARIGLLDAIRATGSITGAAKAVGMSYKGAWDAIDAMNNLAGEALVLRATGGKGGGGTTLTPRALRLIETYRTIEHEHGRFLERAARLLAGGDRAEGTTAENADENADENAGQSGFERDLAMLGRFAMRTSARNQLFGTVTGIVRGAVNDEVSMALPGGEAIVATVTHESVEMLALGEGAPVVALVKATSIVLVADAADAARLSARNRLSGTVEVLRRGAVNADVSIVLPGGAVLAAIVTEASVEALGLVIGKPATAVFKASSVLLGAAG
ncbi:TOBE domain-containing protein [Paraburkholderia acidisoli]|uniref:LysR family transcriptional regulator n=1 Tax=Paraburkholderia acidisoli TaxID=2571748 RepID=A0A7Z2GKU1_9BURK|nr:TOBE domain-containing protein [Paraburkholderia acidisoli]QGZ63647.1 LysR family transcriptional regulator [Paraburkholderia acidisoli]